MLAAVHLENLLFLLFIFVVFLFQLLTRAASKASKGPDKSTPTKPRTTSPVTPRTRPETDEERIRKFLEALGQPAGSAPPPPVKPQPTYQKPIVLPHVGPFESPLPPLTTKPPPLPRKVIQPAQPAAAREHKAYQPRVAEASRFEVHDVTQLSQPVVSIKAPEQSGAIQGVAREVRIEKDFMALLKSPAGLRNAIILREIFGPPRAFNM